MGPDDELYVIGGTRVLRIDEKGCQVFLDDPSIPVATVFSQRRCREQGPPYVYVDAGADSHGQGSRDDPFTTIQEAIDIYDSGKHAGIMVLAGIYTGEGNDNIDFSDKDVPVHISDTVELISSSLKGSAVIHLRDGDVLRLKDCRVKCNVEGPGTIEVPPGYGLLLTGNATIDLADASNASRSGRFKCHGSLKLNEGAVILNTTIDVAPSAHFVIKEGAGLYNNAIHASNDDYLTVHTETYTGELLDNRVYIHIDANDLFELRSRDLYCQEADCAGEAIQLTDTDMPGFDSSTRTLERLALSENTKLTLANHCVDQHGANEALYVRKLILEPNSVLDLGFNRLYYQDLEMDPDESALIVNTPLIDGSIDVIDFDDVNEYRNRIETNNPQDIMLVERIWGQQPDPNGMMLMQNLEDSDPARAKARFGPCTNCKLLLTFKYLFPTAGEELELVIYLSDLPGALDQDPTGIEVGRVVPPEAGRPGAWGSGRFAEFQVWIQTGALDLRYGTWIEFQLVDAGTPRMLQSIHTSAVDPGRKRLAALEGDQGGVFVDDLNLIYCSGYCGDLNYSNSVAQDDFLYVLAAYGRTVKDSESIPCLEFWFSEDNRIDTLDVISWDWGIADLPDAGIGSLCPSECDRDASGLEENQVYAAHSATTGDFRLGQAPADRDLSDLLVAAKHVTGEAVFKGLTDLFYTGYNDGGDYAWREIDFATGPAKCTSHLYTNTSDAQHLYLVNSVHGVTRYSSTLQQTELIPPGIVRSDINDLRYNSPAEVRIGVIDWLSPTECCPILDVVVEDDYAYVVPAVIVPDSDISAPYHAAVKLRLLDPDQSPPYALETIYDDPYSNDQNPVLAPREIEIDSVGDVYVLNRHGRNESDHIVKYSNGETTMGEPLEASGYGIDNPARLLFSKKRSAFYLASKPPERSKLDGSRVYEYAVLDMGRMDSIPKRTIDIRDMDYITGMAEDPATGTLYVLGFNREAGLTFPVLRNDFYHPRFAVVSTNASRVQAQDLSGVFGTGVLPMSIVWTGSMESE